MSSDFMVFLPACIAKYRASLAIFMPIFCRASASSLAAASLTRSAPAFLFVVFYSLFFITQFYMVLLREF